MTLTAPPYPQCQFTQDMGSASAVGWPPWPSSPVLRPTGPGGCPPGTVPAADRYGPICAGVGHGGLMYVEANAQLQPGPTRWGPPEHWCAPGTCPEGSEFTAAVDAPPSGCPAGSEQLPPGPRMYNPRWHQAREANVKPHHAAARGALGAAIGLIGSAVGGPAGAIAGAAAGSALGAHLQGVLERRSKNPIGGGECGRWCNERYPGSHQFPEWQRCFDACKGCEGTPGSEWLLCMAELRARHGLPQPARKPSYAVQVAIRRRARRRGPRRRVRAVL